MYVMYTIEVHTNLLGYAFLTPCVVITLHRFDGRLQRDRQSRRTTIESWTTSDSQRHRKVISYRWEQDNKHLSAVSMTIESHTITFSQRPWCSLRALQSKNLHGLEEYWELHNQRLSAALMTIEKLHNLSLPTVISKTMIPLENS